LILHIGHRNIAQFLMFRLLPFWFSGHKRTYYDPGRKFISSPDLIFFVTVIIYRYQ